MQDIWKGFSENVLNVIKGKKVYIWGEYTFESLCIFIMAVQKKVYIQAFVHHKKLSDQFEIFNKKIISLQEVEVDGVVLVTKGTNQKDLDELRSRGVEFIEVPVYELADDIELGEVYIYGAGERGNTTFHTLQEKGIEISGYIDSSEEKIGKWLNERQIADVEEVPRDAVIVISSAYYKEIIQKLTIKGFDKIYIDYGTIANVSYPYWVMETEEHELNAVVWSLNWHFYVFMRDIFPKDIIIDGYNDYGKQIDDFCELIDKKIKFYCDVQKPWREEIRTIYDLLYEDMSNSIVLVTKFEQTRDRNHLCKEIKLLEELGLVYISHFREISRMPDDAIRDNRVDCRYGWKPDPLLGYTICYPQMSKRYEQYFVLGNEKNAKKRVLILGGSTSDIGLYASIKSWPELLYEYLKQEDVVMFCGAIGGYNARQECLKLLRDIHMIKPDVVISYSGVNDAYPMLVPEHPFYHPNPISCCKIAMKTGDISLGMRNEESSDELWLRMEQTMKTIAENANSDFIGILQPTIYNKKMLRGNERVISYYQDNSARKKYSYIAGCNRNLRFAKNAKEKMPNDMYDLTDVLVDEQEVFKDTVHLYESGNRKIANEIYKIWRERYSNGCIGDFSIIS